MHHKTRNYKIPIVGEKRSGARRTNSFFSLVLLLGLRMVVRLWIMFCLLFATDFSLFSAIIALVVSARVPHQQQKNCSDWSRLPQSESPTNHSIRDKATNERKKPHRKRWKLKHKNRVENEEQTKERRRKAEQKIPTQICIPLLVHRVRGMHAFAYGSWNEMRNEICYFFFLLCITSSSAQISTAATANRTESADKLLNAEQTK